MAWRAVRPIAHSMNSHGILCHPAAVIGWLGPSDVEPPKVVIESGALMQDLQPLANPAGEVAIRHPCFMPRAPNEQRRAASRRTNLTRGLWAPPGWLDMSSRHKATHSSLMALAI